MSVAEADSLQLLSHRKSPLKIFRVLKIKAYPNLTVGNGAAEGRRTLANRTRYCTPKSVLPRSTGWAKGRKIRAAKHTVTAVTN